MLRTGACMDKTEQILMDFFGGAVSRAFNSFIELRDDEIQIYIAAMLAEFHMSDHLWNVRDANERSLVQVAELLAEADPVFGNAPSFERERQVRKHVGDYTLFLAGMFPEGLNRSRFRRMRRPDDPTDLIKVGRESYLAVASFDELARREEAFLFRKLSKRFGTCVEGLRLAAREFPSSP